MGSLRARRHNAVHAQILDHLSLRIEGVGDGECGQVQAWRFAVLRGLQHVLRSQHHRGFVTQGKRILQELNDVGFGLYVMLHRGLLIFEVKVVTPEETHTNRLC